MFTPVEENANVKDKHWTMNGETQIVYHNVV